MKRLLKSTLLTTGGCLLTISGLFAQKDVPKGWHLQDRTDSGYYGISMARAYEFVKTKNLKSTPVIVAVIDSGVDTLHEDLKQVLWKNPREIPGNNIDDDNNGYVDDIYGWNFLGGRDGRNVEQDSYEAARVYHQYKQKWDGKTFDLKSLSKAEADEYEMWRRSAKDIVGNEESGSKEDVLMMKRAYDNMVASDSIIRKALGKELYTGTELDSFSATGSDVRRAKLAFLSLLKGNDMLESTNTDFLEGFGDYVNGELRKAEAKEKAPENFRGNIVKDNYADFNDRYYGNNNVMVSNKSALHGTHVSGIIGAARGNGVGMDGVADNVRIMTIRAVPDGDEHDKDIALAIRYAVDNGARVINMSFGKGFSPEKKWVDDAVKYANSKGVLLVHAAGNSAQNLDTTWNFPTAVYQDKTKAPNWITVGASGDPLAGGLTASFSNYGKKEVDVFAPGVKIYSTVPGGNTYQNLQGTSMASPVVAGMAAFLMEYYPDLSAAQIKQVIEKSAQKPAINVKNPGTAEDVKLSDLSRSGGVINAYEAIKLASTMKPEGKNKVKPVKSKVKTKVKS